MLLKWCLSLMCTVSCCDSSQVQKTLNWSCSAFDWLTHSVRIGLQVIRLMFFSVFPMLGECYPGGIESRGQRKSGALVIDILQLSPLLAGLLSFLCSSVWTWFISLSITLFLKFLEIMPSKWFFQVEFQILSDAFHLMIYARITENVFEKLFFLLPLSPLKLTPLGVFCIFFACRKERKLHVIQNAM